MKFNCTSCGLCCKKLGQAIAAAKSRKEPSEIDALFLEFPYPPKPDGSCFMLKNDGSCSIYNERPLICDVDKMYEKFYKPHMSKKEHYRLNAWTCNQMINEAGLPKEYLIDEKRYKDGKRKDRKPRN